MKWSKQKCRKVAFIISFFYVLLGTLVGMFAYGSHNVLKIDTDSVWYWLLFIFTSPVSLVVMMVRYPTTSVWAIIIPALIMLLIIWLIINGVLWLIKGDKNSEFK